MVSKTTKTIILIMTLIVMGVMAYLVHSPKFLGTADGSKSAFFDKIQKRIAQKKQEVANTENNLVKKSNINVLDNKKVNIIVALPLSGNNLNLGESIKTSIELAEMEKDFLDGMSYNITYEDSEKEGFIQRIEEKIKTDKNIVLLSLSNEIAEKVANISDKHAVPHLTCAYGRGVSKNHKYTINHYPSSNSVASDFLDNLDLNNMRIFSIITDNKPHMLEILEMIEKGARERSFAILNKIIIKEGKEDFSNDVNLIGSTRSEAIMVMLSPRDLEVFAQAMEDEEIVSTYTSIDTLYTFHNRRLIDGASFIIASDGDNDFKNAFREKSVLQIPICGPRLYDAFKMSVLAYKELPSTASSTEVFTYLSNIKDFLSATGEKISVSAERNIDSPTVRMKIEKNTIKYQ